MFRCFKTVLLSHDCIKMFIYAGSNFKPEMVYSGRLIFYKASLTITPNTPLSSLSYLSSSSCLFLSYALYSSSARCSFLCFSNKAFLAFDFYSFASFIYKASSSSRFYSSRCFFYFSFACSVFGKSSVL